MIRLNVFIRTTESNRAEILSVAKELVTASLKDEGCIAYDIFESATRPDVLIICELFIVSSTYHSIRHFFPERQRRFQVILKNPTMHVFL